MLTRGIAWGAAAVAAFAAFGTAGPAAGVLAARVSPGITWGSCPPDLSHTLRCGTVVVPLDHDHPDAGTTTLGVSLAQATGRKVGTILVNPGGPGGRGMWLAAAVQQRLPADLRESYDIVGVDPRGNGHSSPIQCVDTQTFDHAPKPDPIPHSEADKAALLARAHAYADGCAAQGGPLLSHLTTEDNAHDLDAVRAALGESKVSYIGWSYGTYLGAVYAQLYPQRVDRLILDSVVDPRPAGIWYGVNLGQDLAFQTRWQDFTAWAARHDDVLGLGAKPGEVDAALSAVLDGVRDRPAGPVGPAEVYDTVTSAMYQDTRWPELARALRAYLDHNSTPLTELYQPPDERSANETAVYTAVECSDAPWPHDWAVWNRDAVALNRAHPILTWPNTWLNAPCMFWPVAPRAPLTVDGHGLRGALLIQAERDAATPLEGAAAMHKALPTSRMVLVRDEGNHGQLMFNPNPCVSDAAFAYLRTGALPANDVACARGPEPDPNPNTKNTKNPANATRGTTR
jgi:pimeloyl-ACP methyl ester carboxylesterase